MDLTCKNVRAMEKKLLFLKNHYNLSAMLLAVKVYSKSHYPSKSGEV